MTTRIKVGDTVCICESFGYHEKTDEPIYPDVNEIGKYGEVTARFGRGWNVRLYDGGKEYFAMPKHLEKITFQIVDYKGSTVATGENLAKMMEIHDEFVNGGEDGYWTLYGCDDDSIWVSGGLEELDPMRDE